MLKKMNELTIHQVVTVTTSVPETAFLTREMALAFSFTMMGGCVNHVNCVTLHVEALVNPDCLIFTL